jgi:prevent-host-death family protein
MVVVTATEAKNRLGRILRQAATEPVTIERSGCPAAVLVSYDEFERYRLIEDAYWGDRAKAAREKGGYLTGDFS